MTTNIQAIREKICELGRLLYDRNLTDTAGGNLSARVGEYIIIDPRTALLKEGIAKYVIANE